ncbi:MAG: hypothetical protein MK213_01075 [Planctomycetes bacterium]|nr:hypothetical protein [Planctomycetota bacterium]
MNPTSLLPVLLVSALGGLGLKQEVRQDPAPVDFQIRFRGPTKAIPLGIGTGINDLSNAQPPVWRVWAEAAQPQGGLARIWLDYLKGPLGPQVQAARRAGRAGMDVLLVAVGDPVLRGEDREKIGEAPEDPEAWADQVVADAQRLLREGVPLTHVELWNEPNLDGQWLQGPKAFGRFFAQAGKRMREQLPPTIRIGGPGMASAMGTALDWFEACFESSAAIGFAPDFASWHFYSSYPSDNERCRFGERIQERARRHGFDNLELVLSEWNVELPHPTAPECDDHRAAAFFVAMNASLVATGTHHSQFFFLQDGYWEARQDYQGQSVGMFTLRGGVKAVFNGLRLFQKVSPHPVVPVEREAAPWNLVCLATKQDGLRQVLLANAFGNPEKRVRHFVDSQGVKLGSYQGQENILQGYLSGQGSLDRLRGPAKDRPIWKEARSLLAESKHEMGLTQRRVSLGFDEHPGVLSAVWVIGPGLSDPWADASYREFFQTQAVEAPVRVAEIVLEEMAAKGIPEETIAEVKAALNQPSPAEILAAIRDPASPWTVSFQADLEARMRHHLEQHQASLPKLLSSHPGAALQKVHPKDWVQTGEGPWSVNVPPWTVVLLEMNADDED